MNSDEFGINPSNLKIPINVVISLIIGLAVGLIEDVPIKYMPDVLVISLAGGFFLQEILLVQRTAWPETNKWYSIGTGEYENEAEEYEKMLKSKFSKDRLHPSRFMGWERKAFYFLPIIIIFTFGIILLFISDRDINFISVARILSISLILVLGLEPIMGTLNQKPIATVGATFIYGVAIYLGLSGFPELALDLETRIGPFYSLACSAGALSYLLLSARWSYYLAFCYNKMDEWRDICIKSGLPLLFILYPQFPDYLETITRIFVGI